MFNYVMWAATPPRDLITDTYTAITRYLWYPSTANILKRNILKLKPYCGGINFPDIDMRKKVCCLYFFIRVLSNKEELSWRRCFWHFYSQVQFMSKRQLNNINIPQRYKQIRLVVIESEFRRDGQFCLFLGKIFALDKVTSKLLSDNWVNHSFKGKMDPPNKHWGN